MTIHRNSWEKKAAEKRASTFGKIPPEWRLDHADLERAKKQRDLTGSFIQQYLEPDEVAIISRDSVDIADAVRQGMLTAFTVTAAMCKAAAIAHQIVSRLRSTRVSGYSLTDISDQNTIPE